MLDLGGTSSAHSVSHGHDLALEYRAEVFGVSSFMGILDIGFGKSNTSKVHLKASNKLGSAHVARNDVEQLIHVVTAI